MLMFVRLGRDTPSRQGDGGNKPKLRQANMGLCSDEDKLDSPVAGEEKPASASVTLELWGCPTPSVDWPNGPIWWLGSK